MLYAQDIVVPANTVANTILGIPSSVNIDRIRVSPGTTGQVWIGFPDGCYGLVHLCVWHWGWQVWPAQPGYSFHWNDYIYTFDDPYPLTTEPYEFVVKTWSYDDRYDHTLFFGVIVKPTPMILTAVSMEQVYAELGMEPGEGI